MSASYNRVILIGNLCRDPEVKQAPSGTPLCDLRLAVNESYKTPSGELHESTHFVDVTVWDRQATNCQTYLRKGSSILVEGRLQYDEWKTPQNETRSKLRVRADRVQFLGPRPTGDVPGGSGAPANIGAPA
ncbi:MAG: single-stranded DNA-binding protein, partial [Kiritimatiellaeota bacterium]|nr:single-stranded DNA-binding protein [Kiritimatiellota bacterium]